MSSYVLIEDNPLDTPSRLKFNPMIEVNEIPLEDREKVRLNEIDGKAIRSSKRYKSTDE